MIKVYARTDERGRVLEMASSVFLKDLSGWTEIDQGEGDRYAHAQGNFLEKPLTGEDGVHNYRLEEGTIRETTEEEKAAERESFPGPDPGEENKIEARIAALQSQLDALLGVKE